MEHAGDTDVIASSDQGYENEADCSMVAQKLLHGDYSPVRQDHPRIG